MSTDKTAEHLCLSCSLANWRKTSNGRLHPDGQGRCGWKPPYIPTPAAWTWNLRNRNQPEPTWGWIERKPATPITDCETYEVMQHAAA